MMLGSVEPTPYDLRFSLFGIPVRVHPLFWVFSAIMGWNTDMRLVGIWVACVFVSILVHEFGHALTARYYHWHPEVVLHAFGGYAAYMAAWGRSTARSILVTFAGPGAGFMLYAIVHLIRRALVLEEVHVPYYARVAIADLEYINLWWGLMNLLPVYPLDGGQISHAAFSHWRGYHGGQFAMKLSLVTAVLIAVAAFHFGRTYVALLFGSLAVDNFQALQTGRPR